MSQTQCRRLNSPVIFQKELTFKPKEQFEIIDITEEMQKLVRSMHITIGFMHLISMHTTTAILLNENEKFLLNDFRHIFRCFPLGIVPDGYLFGHNDLKMRRITSPTLDESECPNAEAHCCSIFLKNDQMLHIKYGELILGRWQRILLVELDKPKERQISVLIMGG
ncbi:MAG: YjbQ family protein [Parcubacteria group bacterium]|nr:YjbQ family protein [Parcubacteria group bacterium]